MLDVRWSPPYKVYEGPYPRWRREWCIPAQHVNGFFQFWKQHKFEMLVDGFTVKKSDVDNCWYLFETKDAVGQFQTIGKQSNAPVYVEPHPGFVLPPYEIKDKSGLRPWQVDGAGKLVSAIKQWGSAIDGSDTGVGKCLTKGTKVKMYDGSTKNVEDVKVGDLLMGDDRFSRTVKSLARGEDELYKIVPTKYGEEWGCNSEHILVLYNTRTKILGEFSVKDYLNKASKSTRFKHEWKLIRTGVEYPDRDLGISPYFLGLWIGDGTWNSISITASENEKEIIDFLYSYAPYTGSRIVKSNKKVGSKAITFYFRGKEHGYNSLLNEFKSYGYIKTREKFIPREYLICESYKRRSLLAGIIDSDGTKCNNGCYEIVTKWDRLKNDIVELARSLGYGVNYKKRTILAENNNFGVTGDYWRIHISGAHDIPCQISRKKSTSRKQSKSVLVSGFKVIPQGRGEYYGFEITGNRRFLLGDFTITHNTYTACAVARELDLNILVVCPKAVIKSWKKVICNHFKMKDKLVGIINYEKLRTGRKDSEIASYVLKRHTKREVFTWKIPKKTLIIWDESQKLKNWKTQNVKTCVAALKEGYPMLFCSATNATNPLEMRMVGLALKIFKASATAYYDWAKAHGVYKGTWGMEFNNDPVALKRIHHTLFNQSGVRLRRDEIPNFPECEIISEVYNMDEEDANKINEIYKEMSRELKLVEKHEKIDKSNADKKKKEQSILTIQLRARQKIELIKVPLFVDMVEEAIEQGFSVVVFVNFVETIKALSERLGTKCIFDGQTPNRDQNVEDFQADKQRVILINIQSGGAGLNLHDLNGKYPRMSIISPTYSPIYMRQALGRIWRDDAKTKAIQKVVCVANTVEENVCRNVQQKLDNMDMLNDGDLEYAENYEIINN